jgi:hypothetical protein
MLLLGEEERLQLLYVYTFPVDASFPGLQNGRAAHLPTSALLREQELILRLKNKARKIKI